MNNLVELEAVWIIVALTGFVGLMGWINYFILRWKWNILKKMIEMEKLRDDPVLDEIFRRLKE